MAFRAAQQSYTGKSEIEAYFQNSVMPDAGLSIKLHQSMYQKCVADSGLPIAGSFRQALDESFGQNKNNPRYGTCMAFNERRITTEQVMRFAIATDGRFDTQYKADDPRMPIYEQGLSAQCKEHPGDSLAKHIQAIAWELKLKEQKDRQEAEEKAEQQVIAETAALSEKVRAEVQAGKMPVCTDMERLKSDRNAESKGAIDAGTNSAIDFALSKLSLEHAAYARQNIGRAANGADFRQCAEKGGDAMDAVREYDWSDDLSTWLPGNEYAIEQERSRRGQAPESTEAPMTDEQELELQRERVSRFDAEEARSKEEN